MDNIFKLLREITIKRIYFYGETARKLKRKIFEHAKKEQGLRQLLSKKAFDSAPDRVPVYPRFI